MSWEKMKASVFFHPGRWHCKHRNLYTWLLLSSIWSNGSRRFW